MNAYPINPFPDPRSADAEGLVAVGGRLTPELLAAAYDQGIFPWYNRGQRVHWWSPDPRCVFDPDQLHVAHSLARTIRRGRFRVTWNTAFREVMEQCGRERAEGTWIHPAMVQVYSAAHEAGWAHSIEVWADAALVGGLYGVQRGAAFMAESMFHRVTDASKVALVTAVRTLFASGVRLFEAQFLTAHLRSLGGYEIPRDEYLERLAGLRGVQLDLCEYLRSP